MAFEPETFLFFSTHSAPSSLSPVGIVFLDLTVPHVESNPLKIEQNNNGIVYAPSDIASKLQSKCIDLETNITKIIERDALPQPEDMEKTKNNLLSIFKFAAEELCLANYYNKTDSESEASISTTLEKCKNAYDKLLKKYGKAQLDNQNCAIAKNGAQLCHYQLTDANQKTTTRYTLVMLKDGEIQDTLFANEKEPLKDWRKNNSTTEKVHLDL